MKMASVPVRRNIDSSHRPAMQHVIMTSSIRPQLGTPKGHVFGATIVPEKKSKLAFVTTKANKKYMEIHQLLGHPGRDKLLGTSDRMNWKIQIGHANECEDCLIGKARRMNLNREADNCATIPGERIMIDIISTKNKKQMKIGRFWLIVVDEATYMKWSCFLGTKKQQVPLLLGLIKKLKEMGQRVRYIRCDNAGENITLQKELNNEGSNIQFKFTARQTPQQNRKVERAFATLYGQMRAVMTSAGVDEDTKHKLWMEAAAMATKLDNIKFLQEVLQARPRL